MIERNTSNLLFIPFYFVLISIFVTASCSPDDEPVPIDSELIAIFDSNIEVFNEMIKVLFDKKISVVCLDDNSLPSEIYDFFKKSMITTSVKQIHVLSSVNHEVNFTVYSSGWATGSTTKGFTYYEGEQINVVDDLDDFVEKNKRNNLLSAYRKINDNWYIFFEHDG